MPFSAKAPSRQIRAVLWGACLLFSVAGSNAAAPHPTALTVVFKDKEFSILSVIKDDPVVKIGRKEKRLRSKFTYRTTRTQGFGPGFVTVSEANTAFDEKNVTYHASWRADRDIVGGYALLCGYDDKRVGDAIEAANVTFGVHELPNIEAGQDIMLTLRQTVPNPTQGLRCFVQIFDADGSEIPTSENQAAWRYYGLIEKARQRIALADYVTRFAGQDHGATPLVWPPTFFPPGVKPPSKALIVRLAISGDGLVTDVVIDANLDAEVAAIVRETLRGWLFLPGLLDGRPVASTIEMPIQF